MLVTAWGIYMTSMGLGIFRSEECCEVLSSMDGDVWQTALRPDVSGIAVDARLFHEAGCRLVHRYRVYNVQEPISPPGAQGGGGGGCFIVCCHL